MIEVVALFFDGTDLAARVLGDLRHDAPDDWTWLEDVAVVERHHSGRVATHLTHGGSVTEGTAIGVVTGALVGLVFPPASLGALAVLAGAAGAGIEKLRKDTELPATVASEIQTRLTKGSSALVLVGETADVNVLDAATMQFAVRDRLRQTLPDDVVDGMTGRFA